MPGPSHADRLQRLFHGVCLVLAISGTASPAFAQAPPDYDWEWVTIGDPGNRDTTQEEAPGFWGDGAHYLNHGVGGVPYEFRMARTEITNAQWLEFVIAYQPYWDGASVDSNFIGTGIHWDFRTDTYSVPPGGEDYPIGVTWRLAARFCNWLHNGKAEHREAFERGVYDTSTFGRHDDETLTDLSRRSHGARFWIPDLDEWTKAMHWDPDKVAPGEGGYWRYPASSDEPDYDHNWGWLRPVASFPHVQSPWEMYDGSGGRAEMTETFLSMPFGRKTRGSEHDTPFWISDDEIDSVGGMAPMGSKRGLRLASAVFEPCCSADLAVPSGVLDLLDMQAFIEAYVNGNPAADLAKPAGSIDTADIALFIDAFVAGCL